MLSCFPGVGVGGTGKALNIQFGLEILTLLCQYRGFTHPRLLKLQECVFRKKNNEICCHFFLLILNFDAWNSKGKTPTVSYQKSRHLMK